MTIAIIDFGMGNIHSIHKAIELCGKPALYTKNLDAIADANGIILPGDGAFPSAMHGFNSELRQLVFEKIATETPILCICIGFQMLFEDSDESQENSVCSGLGLIHGKIRKFQFDNDPSLRIPHMGWNQLKITHNNIWCKNGDYAYFIHSYRAEQVPQEFVVATTEYGNQDFPAIIKKNSILATQFHPEKSSTFGLQLLQTWVKQCYSS